MFQKNSSLNAMLTGLVVGIFLMLANPARADDAWAINDIAVLVDPSGVENIDSVSQPGRAGEFKPAPHGFSAGFTRSVHWIRFTVNAPPKDAQGKRELLLEIHPPYVDDLKLYLSSPGRIGAFETRLGGDLRSHAAKEYPYRAFVFPILFTDNSPRIAYVRLKTTSSSVLAITAWEPGQFAAKNAREYALLGLLLGGFLAGLIANIWQGLWRYEALYRRYIAYMVVTLINTIGINGLVAEFLLPQSPVLASHWVSIGTLLMTVFGTRFYMLALDIDHAPTWMQWVYRIQLTVAVACLPAPFFDFYPEAARVVLPLVSLMLMTGTLRSIQLWRRRDNTGKILLLSHVLSLTSTLSIVPTLLGIFPGQFWLIYGFQFGPIGSLLALQLMMTRRVRGMQTKLNEVNLDIEVAKATAHQARAERDHQRHFLSMLTHELKTPLSVIRLRLGAMDPTLRMQAHATQAVEDIDAIVERCAMVSQIDEKSEALQITTCRIDELLNEILIQQQKEHRVELKYSGESIDTILKTDPVFLRTVLANLIDNAVKYSPPHGHVRIDIASKSKGTRNGVRIQVENAAWVAGTPNPVLMFEKYYRAPGAHLQSGSGLGLYIVKALTERLGGSVHCRQQTDLVILDLWLPHYPLPSP